MRLLKICMTAQIIWTLTGYHEWISQPNTNRKDTERDFHTKNLYQFIRTNSHKSFSIFVFHSGIWYFVFRLVFKSNEIFRKTQPKIKCVLTSGRSKPMENENKYIQKNKIYHSQTLNWNTGETMWVKNVCGFFTFKNESYQIHDSRLMTHSQSKKMRWCGKSFLNRNLTLNTMKICSSVVLILVLPQIANTHSFPFDSIRFVACAGIFFFYHQNRQSERKSRIVNKPNQYQLHDDGKIGAIILQSHNSVTKYCRITSNTSNTST